MELTMSLWFLFPIAVLISTIAMASGIGGAVFFSPLFMIALQLEPRIAIGAALVTELFGFSSGLIAYYKARLIDFSLAGNLLIFSIPAAVLGTIYSDLVPAIVLKSIFAVGLIGIGYQLFAAWRREEKEKFEARFAEEYSLDYESELIDSHGHVYHYTVCHKNTGRLFAFIGGVFVGMISVGLAELQEYQLVARCKVPTPVSVATSIFVVVITVLVASVGHFFEFAQGEIGVLNQVINVVVFTIPGVIIGGQLGPVIQKRVPEEKIKVGISILFVLVGIFMLSTLAGVGQ